MAERNEQVMDLVTREIERDPNISVDALFEQARAIDPAIGELSLRQFHARYPLPVKRRRSQGKRARKPPKGRAPARSAASKKASKPAGGTPRDELRRIFLDFAGDLARAESRASIVEVLARVDEYVDRAMDTSGRRKS